MSIKVLFLAVMLAGSGFGQENKVDSSSKLFSLVERRLVVPVQSVSAQTALVSKPFFLVPTFSFALPPKVANAGGVTNAVPFSPKKEKPTDKITALPLGLRLEVPEPEPFRGLLYYEHFDEPIRRISGYDAFGKIWRLSPNTEIIFPMCRWRYPSVRGEDVAICVAWQHKF